MGVYKAEVPYNMGAILTIMQNYYKIREACLYGGNISQMDVVIDLDRIIQEAVLTKRQMEVVELYYYQQFTQEETAEILGITQQGVLDHIQRIKNKINEVAIEWGEEHERV